MSEEILKALAQLYAIITKQDSGVTEKERAYVITSFKRKLNQVTVKEYVELYDQLVGYNEVKQDLDDKKEKLTSMKDSVKTLGLCKKINKTLTQKQKIVVLVELLELVKSDGNFTPQRMQIIDTVSIAFNIEKDEYKNIEQFVLSENIADLQDENILIINDCPAISSGDDKHMLSDSNEGDMVFINYGKAKHVFSEYMEGNLIFLNIKAAEMIFMKYQGSSLVILNGLEVQPNNVVLFSNGSSVKSPKGSCFYYSDVQSHFVSEMREVRLSFNIHDVSYKFDNGVLGLRNIHLSEGPGKLIGIMGASGAGKTTLLNVMAGLEKPTSGSVVINGIDLHANNDQVRGVIGYISQDDILIEELTVFENIYYNAKLCFKDLSEEEMTVLVDKVLSNLGLLHIKHIQVGNTLNKKISGGQRKRLNIALELIREPSVLFVDEPTSGLSSRDSENVIDLLKELTLKGTLIFVVIHQPSSDIYKMFDKMLILDTGGYLIFNGHPVEAVTYFKKVSKHADSEKGQCDSCGNVNPEQIFNIIEEKVVDEYGQFTPNRKVTPNQWQEYYLQNFSLKFLTDITDVPLKILKIPSLIKQFLIYSVRDLKSKISNRQYMMINLLEAPVLALILAFIIRYDNDPTHSKYLLRYNENLPAYILMSIVVALFMGLSVSAEEIIKDKKILKRESFLNLSRSSYLYSKLFILFSFSAIQTLLFVLVGNLILDVQGMFFAYWLVLFTTACMANVLGLIISSAFSTAVTVYICIPLLLIPQMILSGAMFNFDKINNIIKSEDKVPLVADMMVSRWAYEALTVYEYKNNNYEKFLYPSEQLERITNFNMVYTIPEMKEKLNILKEAIDKKEKQKEKEKDALTFLRNELMKQSGVNKNINAQLLTTLHPDHFNENTFYAVSKIIDELENTYQNVFNEANKRKDIILTSLDAQKVKDESLKDHFYNESLSDLVRNVNAKERYIESHGEIIPKIDPVFFNPASSQGPLGYRTHFYAPSKYFMGRYIDTFVFNIFIIWCQTLFLYLLLYFNVLKKVLDFFGNLSFQKFKFNQK